MWRQSGRRRVVTRGGDGQDFVEETTEGGKPHMKAREV